MTANNGLGTGHPDCVEFVAVDPQNPANVYAAMSNGIYKSTDGGMNWFSSGGGIDNKAVRGLAIDPQNSTILYAGTEHRWTPGNGGVYKSTDSGVWHILKSGSPGSYITQQWGMAGDVAISAITGILNSIP